MCIYGGSRPIYISHMKLLPLTVLPELLYTDDGDNDSNDNDSPITYTELATWPNQSQNKPTGPVPIWPNITIVVNVAF